jgi:hypothetical protein
MEHFKLRHEDIMEKVQHIKQAIGSAAAGGMAGPSRPASPSRLQSAKPGFSAYDDLYAQRPY